MTGDSIRVGSDSKVQLHEFQLGARLWLRLNQQHVDMFDRYKYSNLFIIIITLDRPVEKMEGRVKPTHVMTSFNDSIAFSSVILSGLSSDVCFLISAIQKERDSLFFVSVERQEEMTSSESKERREEQRGKEIIIIKEGERQGGK